MELLKFTDRKWALKLMNGEIYANSIYNFRQMEDQIGRGDLFEGSIKTINKNDINNESFFKDFSQDLIDNIMGNVVYIDEFSQYLKVFSLYCTNGNRPINEKVLEFGDTCVVIKNIDEFLERIAQTLNDMNINIDAFEVKKVEYYDFEDKTKYLNPFYKLGRMSWQNEYRIVFYPGNKISVFDRLPINLNIGSIDDIAELKDSRTFVKEHNQK